MATISFFFFFFSFFAFVRASLKPLDPSITLPLSNLKKAPASWNETVSLTHSGDKERLSYLSSVAVGPKVPVPISYNKSLGHMFVVQIKIGSPPQKLLMAIDTSHDVALVPCSGASSGYNSLKSTTFKTVNCSDPLCTKAGSVDRRTCGRKDPCVFSSTYRESDFSAKLARDNIILGHSDSVPGYTFGCIQSDKGKSIPTQGMLGLGRQSLSLLTQTPRLYKYTFSYCLPNLNSPHYFTGSLTLGNRKQPKNIRTTPLIGSNNLYRVNLIGVMLGETALNISRDKVNGGIGNGTVIDSGTVYSVLVEPAYNALRIAIYRKLRTYMFKYGGFDTCYRIKKEPKIGNVTLVFPGMNFTLGQENFLIRSSKSPIYCLAISTHHSIGFNVIGSFQQQNHRVFFDIRNSRLGVAQEQCS